MDDENKEAAPSAAAGAPAKAAGMIGRMSVAFVMGFASGLPLLLTSSLLQAWMSDAGIDLAAIGLTALLGLPYTVKFLWAPLLDRFVPPFLGRRRGWLLISQLLLAGAIVALGASDPRGVLWQLGAAAFAVTLLSATQDIVVDAYRREALPDRELGLGASLFVNGYRLGMLAASGGGLILADRLSFPTVYPIMAAALLPAMVVTLLAPEPQIAAGVPASLREAVWDPLADYFRRPEALAILAFLLLYKLGDTMASAMTMPFYLDLGFSKTEIGSVVKLFGFWATVGGGLFGGALLLRLGIARSLWIFGLLQAASTAGFSLLSSVGYHVPLLAAVIAFENLTAGMGTSAFVAFMASITNQKFTATQYALLSSLIGVPRVMAAAPTGAMAQALGWSWFFLLCCALAIPGLLLLPRFAPWHVRGTPSPAGAEPKQGAP